LQEAERHMRTSQNKWWELRLNGSVVTRVMGKDNAMWFFDQLQKADPLGHWSLTLYEPTQKQKPITPAEVLMRQEDVFCVGSD